MAGGIKDLELSLDQLKKYCDYTQFDFKTTKEVSPLEETVGQDRAVDALEFGVHMEIHGFNIYVAGPVGTGKSFATKAFVQKAAKEKKVPSDWCYVYNFSDPRQPRAIELPPGKGQVFTKEMDELIKYCRIEIPKVFESEEYERRKELVLNKIQSKRDALLSQAKERAKKMGFKVQVTTAGIIIMPVVKGKPLKREEYEKLPEVDKGEIRQKSKELDEEINQAWKQVRALEREADLTAKDLDREMALFAVGHLLEALKEKYKEHPKISEYLEGVERDIIEHLEDFKSEKKVPFVIPGIEIPFEPSFDRYRVNVVVNNAETQGAPVIIETNPTYYNLFGGIEYQARLGAMVTDFTMIKGGAIHRANGGYLIVRVWDVLTNFMVWDALKRTLRSRLAFIENIGEQFRVIPTVVLKPESIPIDVKVVLMGNRLLYYLLYQLDEDFRKLFKVKADFDVEMDRNDESIRKYVAFIGARCREESLRHFDRKAVAKVVEYGARVAEDKEKLSTRFMEISDLLSEANFWAKQDGNEYVTGEDVERALEKKFYRSNMIEKKIQELIEDGTLLIDTEGEALGQVNGISLLDLGDYVFGKPSRITARVSIGKAGVINIEREAKMSGRIHSKGVMILSGYLSGKYALDKPLSVSASLCFEQSYEEVEGDSASSAELYAILSSLADLTLKQEIAVTGSVNQRGEIQPVGGINQKVEGFFDTCKVKGLTGNQGVMIPRRNIRNLMLRDEVVQAIKNGKFHIWGMGNIDEGIELLTGVEAGERRPDGTYPEGTANYRVNERLREMAQQLKEFGGKETENKQQEN